MNLINLEGKGLNNIGTYDVVVVGGGTAGSVAAIASAREGANTLLVEKFGFLGGSQTASQVTPHMHIGIEGNPKCSIDKKIRDLLKSEGYQDKDPNGNDGWFNPEMLKFALEEIYIKYNGNILYDNVFVDSIVTDGSIDGIIVHNKLGLGIIKGKVFIDCTGDAEVAYDAGVPCFKGNSVDEKNQAVSLRFSIGNIDTKRLQDYLKEIGQSYGLYYPLVETAMVWGSNFPLEKVFQKGLDDGALKYEDGKYFQVFAVPGMTGVMACNCPEIPDCNESIDPVEITNSYIKGKEMIKRLHSFLKNYVCGFEKSYILSVATLLGVRESRRIKGKYILSVDDYNNRTKFNDGIAKTAYPVDVHGGKIENTEIITLKKGEYFEIPFRTLIPLNINNLLVAGRCISSTFVAQSSIRVEPTCRSTGEAAGIAAAYCTKFNVNLAELDGSIIRRMMEKYNDL